MDDALNTLKALAFNTYHHTMTPLSLSNTVQDAKEASFDSLNSISHESHETVTNGLTNGTDLRGSIDTASTCQLLVFSAKDEAALTRMLGHYTEYLKAQIHKSKEALNQLAYTLAARRSAMAWRCFAVVPTETFSRDITWRFKPSKSERLSRDKGLAFVFTGQGAQYARMGLQLLQYPSFKSILVKVDTIFRDLGAAWSLLGKH